MLVFLFSGCGGGTSGTGRPPTTRTITISGTAVNEAGAPVEGLELRSSTDQVTATTSALGLYEMTTQRPTGDELTLELRQGDDAVSSVTFAVDPATERFTVDLIVRAEAEGIEIVDFTVSVPEETSDDLGTTNLAVESEAAADSSSSTTQKVNEADSTSESSSSTAEDEDDEESQEKKPKQTVFRGTILYGDEPLKDAVVSIPQLTNTTARTDRNGKWEIRTKPPRSATTIFVRVRSLDRDGNVTITNPPKAPSVISLTLRFPRPEATTSKSIVKVPLEIVKIRYSRR